MGRNKPKNKTKGKGKRKFPTRRRPLNREARRENPNGRHHAFFVEENTSIVVSTASNALQPDCIEGWLTDMAPTGEGPRSCVSGGTSAVVAQYTSTDLRDKSLEAVKKEKDRFIHNGILTPLCVLPFRLPPLKLSAALKDFRPVWLVFIHAADLSNYFLLDITAFWNVHWPGEEMPKVTVRRELLNGAEFVKAAVVWEAEVHLRARYMWRPTFIRSLHGYDNQAAPWPDKLPVGDEIDKETHGQYIQKQMSRYKVVAN